MANYQQGKVTSAQDILFRCSSLGYIMKDSKKPGELSDTCKKHLVDLYLSARYGIREEHRSKYTEKGNIREEDSITLLSLVMSEPFRKNTERLSNSYITGELDLFQGPEIRKATETLDTKTSWSAHTFFRAKVSKLDPDYEYQGHGYMALTGAQFHTVAYCLVNGTFDDIDAEKRRLAYRLNCFWLDDMPPEYIEGAIQIERNHIFDLAAWNKEHPHFMFDTPPDYYGCDGWPEIPRAERVALFRFARDEKKIAAIYKRINECREWMNENLFNLTVEELANLLKN